jgi:hypothetical protein
MNKIVAMIALSIALSACHVGIGIGDNSRQPTSAASNGWGSALAQASIGTVSGN